MYIFGGPPRYNWNIVESGAKHHTRNLYSVLKLINIVHRTYMDVS
jgi:hypothetical protein